MQQPTAKELRTKQAAEDATRGELPESGLLLPEDGWQWRQLRKQLDRGHMLLCTFKPKSLRDGKGLVSQLVPVEVFAAHAMNAFNRCAGPIRSRPTLLPTGGHTHRY